MLESSIYKVRVHDVSNIHIKLINVYQQALFVWGRTKLGHSCSVSTWFGL